MAHVFSDRCRQMFTLVIAKLDSCDALNFAVLHENARRRAFADAMHRVIDCRTSILLCPLCLHESSSSYVLQLDVECRLLAFCNAL